MKTKKKLSLMLAVIMLLQIILPMVSIIWKSGFTIISNAEDSTEYYINTAQDLWDFAAEVNNGNTFEGVTVNLTADIDLGCSEDNQWITIGRDREFNGVFDGKNHTIKGMYISKMDSENNVNIGLFGRNLGVIRNLIIDDSYIDFDNIESRIVIGTICSYNKGDIYNCINKTNVSVTNIEKKVILGGIVGENDRSGRIVSCTNYGDMSTNTDNAGGIVGSSRNGYINNCKNFGLIKSTNQTNSVGSGIGIGGIVGSSSQGGKILNCLNEGNIVGYNGVGGIVGSTSINNNYYERSINIEYCINKGTISGKQEIGGIIGDYQDYNLNEEENTIYACSNYGEINSVAYSGGIIGSAEFNFTIIKECFNAGEISGKHHLGGLCGAINNSLDNTTASIIDCYNRGNVECGYHLAGGVLGNCDTIYAKNIYTTGNVCYIGTENINDSEMKIRNSLWGYTRITYF